MSKSAIQLYSGKFIELTAPEPKDIEILDIAHALSNLCRFTGHCTTFYSVAQHSTLVSHYIDPTYSNPRLNLAGLLHDASEAYLGDMASPLKNLMPSYKQMEWAFQAVISQCFDVDLVDSQVHEADQRILGDEVANLMSPHDAWKKWLTMGYGAIITPVLPNVAKNDFLSQYDILMRMISAK